VRYFGRYCCHCRSYWGWWVWIFSYILKISSNSATSNVSFSRIFSVFFLDLLSKSFIWKFSSNCCGLLLNRKVWRKFSVSIFWCINYLYFYFQLQPRSRRDSTTLAKESKMVSMMPKTPSTTTLVEPVWLAIIALFTNPAKCSNVRLPIRLGSSLLSSPVFWSWVSLAAFAAASKRSSAAATNFPYLLPFSKQKDLICISKT